MTTYVQIPNADRSRSDDAAPVSYRPLIDLTSDELDMLVSLTDRKAPLSPSEPNVLALQRLVLS